MVGLYDPGRKDPGGRRPADRHRLEQLARPGFEIRFYDTRESFYLAEALEYILAWRQATESRPAGICGPIGPRSSSRSWPCSSTNSN